MSTTIKLGDGTTIKLGDWIDDRAYGSLALINSASDDWVIANIIDAALDEDHRRRGLEPLGPRSDVGHPRPDDPEPGRWPGICRVTSTRTPSSDELIACLDIQAEDLLQTVINVYESIVGRPIEAFTVGKSARVKDA